MKIIIIGGVTAGMSAVSKIAGGIPPQVVVYEKAAICSFATCGLPYYLANPQADLRAAVAAMQDELKAAGAEARCRHEVTGVRFDLKQVTVRNLDTDQVFTDRYDKLVIAAGSHNFIPQVPGAEKVGVQVLKTIEDVIFLREFTKTPYVHDITIVGGSFSGLEIAKAFLKLGRSVRIIEKENQLLPAFDKEVSAIIQKELEAGGVKIHLGETLKAFTGRTFIERTETGRGSYETDLAMLAMGVVPNTEFLHGTGITMEADGAIVINKAMETSVPDVYAVGDCTGKTDGILRTSSIKMADLELARSIVLMGSGSGSLS